MMQFANFSNPIRSELSRQFKKTDGGPGGTKFYLAVCNGLGLFNPAFCDPWFSVGAFLKLSTTGVPSARNRRALASRQLKQRRFGTAQWAWMSSTLRYLWVSPPSVFWLCPGRYDLWRELCVRQNAFKFAFCLVWVSQLPSITSVVLFDAQPTPTWRETLVVRSFSQHELLART